MFAIIIDMHIVCSDVSFHVLYYYEIRELKCIGRSIS